ncbi:MAG: class I SAM-dependent methyltransferase [Bryobacteraceae bacterium]|nr:class I SAM-dependent methyltransferase [Bryobacteraceae bacterium]
MRIEDFRALVATRLLGIWEVEDKALAKLARHHDLFDRWNQRMDQTAVRDTGEAVERHYCEGIFAAGHVPRGTSLIADIGSGAGFPGAVMAAVLPGVTVHLVESNLDKALFLRDSTRGWPNVKVRSSKAANLPDHFDMLVARGMPYRDILALMPKLAKSAMLITTAAEAELVADEIGFVSSAPIAIPWARERVLFHVEHQPL